MTETQMNGGVPPGHIPPGALPRPQQIPQPQGPFTPGGTPGAAPQEPEPVGFDAGEIWTFPYNLNPYVDARGEVPPPTQARLDKFNRAMAKLMIDYENASREAEQTEAAATDERQPVTMEQLDEALAEKNAAVGKVKDAVADLCNGHPTRAQLEKLPEYVFMRFAQVVGRKVNPEG